MEKKKRKKILERIEKAKTALTSEKCFFCIDSKNSLMEFMDLEIDSSEEIWLLISELLNELKPQHHAKTNLKGRKALSPDSEFFTFIWKSDRLKKKVKFIFILNNDCFYYFSLS